MINKIPVYELRHENEEVAFAIRSAKEVSAIFSEVTDKPHRHDYYTVLWSHNASGKHIIDYWEYEMQPNDVFFVSPGQVHQVKHTPDPDATVLLFTCDFLATNSISENFIQELNLSSDIASSPPVKVDDQSALKMENLTTSMRQVFQNDDAFKDEMIGAYLKLFLIECNKFAPLPLSDDTQSIQSGKTIISSFKSLLESNYKDWKKVKQYADALNLTADYLNEVSKTTIGKTAKELIQQRVVIEAKRLGLHTDMTTKEIAYRIGFQDPSQFSKFFKNCEGVSFTDFRNKLEKELSD